MCNKPVEITDALVYLSFSGCHAKDDSFSLPVMQVTHLGDFFTGKVESSALGS